MTLDYSLPQNIDFNDDGSSDLLWRDNTTGEIIIWLMDGSAYTEVAAPRSLSADWGYRVGNFSTSVGTDILWHNNKTGENVIWVLEENEEGDLSFQETVLASTPANGDYQTFDNNSSENSSVLWRNPQTGVLTAWNNVQVSDSLIDISYRQYPLTAGTQGWNYSFANFTNPDNTDIFWYRPETGEIAYSLNGNFDKAPTVYTALHLPKNLSYSVVDFDGNGTSDFLWYDSQTGKVAFSTVNGESESPFSPPVYVQDKAETPQDIVRSAEWEYHVGDFDGDGSTDVLWRNTMTGENDIWLDVSFEEEGVSYTAVREIPLENTVSMWDRSAEWEANIRDLNGDGNDDIFWRNTQTGALDAWFIKSTDLEGNPVLSYTSPAFAQPLSTEWDYDLGNFDGIDTVEGEGGEARLSMTGEGANGSDIIWRNSQTGQVLIWLMDGLEYTGAVVKSLNEDGSLSENDAIFSNEWTSDLADFNGDMKSDIFWRDTIGNMSVWLMDGTQPMQAGFVQILNEEGTPTGENLQLGQEWTSDFGDFNGDEKSDILWRNTQTGQVAVWTMDGTQYLHEQSDLVRLPGTEQEVIVGQEWISELGNFNSADTNSDIFWHNTQTGQLAVWTMDGTGYTSASILKLEDSLQDALVGKEWIFEFGNFNEDTVNDIFWRNTQTGQVAVWEMNQNGTGFEDTYLVKSQTTGQNLQGAEQDVIVSKDWTSDLADFNDDGISDIFWRNTVTGSTAVWLMNTQGGYSEAEVLDTVSSAWTHGITDLNGDGNDDIFWRNSQTGENNAWLMNGTDYASSAFGQLIPQSWSL